MAPRISRAHFLSGLTAMAAATALAACSDSDTDDAADQPAGDAAGSDTSSSTGEWPRTFENSDGTTTEIEAQPQKIASTSVTVSGTLLAIGAPLVASGAAANGQFFPQWADEGQSKGVEVLWPAGETDLEALISVEPDLIVVAATGADSLADQVADLGDIAPTIVVDYGAQDWQDLATDLGKAIGLETEASTAVKDFDDYVTEAAGKITVPEGTANIVAYNGPGENNNIARKGSAHGVLLESLGFTVEDPPEDWNTTDQVRTDFIFANYENLTELTSETSFILTQDDDGAQAFAQDKTLANVPSVKAGQVYGLGLNSFRVDKYSATEIVDGIVENFSA